MIPISFPIKCPWCGEALAESSTIFGDNYKCHCGQAKIADNITFVIEVFNRDNKWFIDNFGMFVNFNSWSFLSFNYNFAETNEVEIAILHISGDEQVLGQIKSIPEKDSDTAFQYAKDTLRRFQKLLVFS